jgi:hypothetical protein
MAFADFSSSDLEKQELPNGLLALDVDQKDRDAPPSTRGATGYRIRLAFLIGSTAILWVAIFALARLILRA